DDLHVDAQGDLVLHTAAGSIRQSEPIIYQQVDGVRREISGGYVLRGANQVGFRVGAYRVDWPLVIDPVILGYSTFLGSVSDDLGKSVAVDAHFGNAYVTGSTPSSTFPTTSGAFDTSFNGANDAFVTEFNPAGSGLVYSTYLGGSADDAFVNGRIIAGIALDESANAYVTGRTASTDFPTTLGAFDTML